MAFGKFIQGLAGNFSEQNKEALIKEYGQYLLENEEIQSGYKLIRDAIIFTNIRIIFTDKQGTTMVVRCLLSHSFDEHCKR